MGTYNNIPLNFIPALILTYLQEKHKIEKKLNPPSDTEATEFCLEPQARYYMKNSHIPPMTVHAYKKYDFDYWKTFMDEDV